MTNLVKGYLPIRISLPSTSGKGNESSFLFVKQHTSSSEASSRTLFVTNTPIYPSIQTRILLSSLFERYADVEKISVAPKPKKDFDQNNDSTMSLFEQEFRSFGKKKAILREQDWCDEGRYAHVIFSTSKGLKKFMNTFLKKKGDACVSFGKLEIQELQDISHQQFLKQKQLWKSEVLGESTGESDDEGEDHNDEVESDRPTGIMALVQTQREQILPRNVLKQMCDQIMAKYEEAEEDAIRKQEEAKNQPDEDGFVTVSYSANVGDVVEFEKNGNLGSTGRRKRDRTRSSKKNVVKGSEELQDFYRFQLKESRKRSLEDIKLRFQEDLKRVKQMKEDKVFRPF